MKTHILFDFDGTLVDTGPGIMAAVRYAVDAMGHPPLAEQALRSFIGPPLDEVFGRHCGFTGEAAAEAIRQFRVYYTKTGVLQSAPYSGTQQMLAKLKAQHRQLHVATTKPVELATQLLRHFELDSYFTTVAGSTPQHPGRPKGEVIFEVLAEAKAPHTDAVMVGDRKYDILGAKENSLPSVGVLYGYGSEAELRQAGANHLVADTAALYTLLASL